MFEKNIPDKDLEKLSRAITEAILNSKDIQKILEEIRKKDLVLPSTIMVMILKLDALWNVSEGMNSEGYNSDINDLKELFNKEKKKDKKQLIDGKELNPNDLAFQEYLDKRFNEEDWLKKNGLIF